MKRDLARLIRDAERRGWRVDRTGSSHHRLRHPAGGLVFAPNSPSCWRSLRNLEADIRRAERSAQGDDDV